LRKLKELLVQDKIMKITEVRLGVKVKTLAEYLLDLAKKSKNSEIFH